MRAQPWLHPVMGAALAAYLLLTALPVGGVPTVVVDWLLPALVVLSAGLAVVRGEEQEPGPRPWATPTGLGICVLLVGLTLGFAEQASGRPVPVALAALTLTAYPLLLVGLVLALRCHLRGLSWPVAIDGLGAGLAGAALATGAMTPLLASAWDGTAVGAVRAAAGTGDVLLVTACFGGLGLVAAGARWPMLAYVGGLGLLGLGRVVAAHQTAAGSSPGSTWPDAVTTTAIVMIAVGAAALRQPGARARLGDGSLGVVASSSVVGIAALAAAPGWEVSVVPSVLALLALAASGVRFVLLVLELRELNEIRTQAFSDELTGCANRRAFHAALDERFEQGGSGFALALVDLDHFKEVNDSYGHGAGDELLREVVRRFAAALKELQTPQVLARLGGDEFAVLLSEVDTPEAALLCGEALQESLGGPVALDSVTLRVRASIGVALAPDHARNRGDMLFAADAAMYVAKSSGERVHLHAPDQVGDRRNRLEVAQDLYTALERGELTVEYQPITGAGGDLVAAEALVRWDHPTRGRLSPAEFLEIAERHRLTPSIAQRVLDVALSDLRRWLDAGIRLRVSVNVSASDLRDEGLVDLVAAGLLRHDVPPSALTIEITETVMMQEPEKAVSVMQALADLGVQLSVDDYGTGYSSLEYLLNLPIHEIKLDRAFSTGLPLDSRAAAIVRSTVELTHALGLRMVAEGVETPQALDMLAELGCDLVQGWYLGRPMSASDFEALASRRLPGQSLDGRHRRSHAGRRSTVGPTG